MDIFSLWVWAQPETVLHTGSWALPRWTCAVILGSIQRDRFSILWNLTFFSPFRYVFWKLLYFYTFKTFKIFFSLHTDLLPFPTYSHLGLKFSMCLFLDSDFFPKTVWNPYSHSQVMGFPLVPPDFQQGSLFPPSVLCVMLQLLHRQWIMMSSSFLQTSALHKELYSPEPLHLFYPPGYISFH